MGWVRDFSGQEEHLPRVRNLENAPNAMRQEIVDALYAVAGESQGQIDVDRDLYLTIVQSLGYQAAGNPQAGRRQRIGRDISQQETHWVRVYDLLVRLWPEFRRVGFQEIYRGAINRILAAHASAWDLGEDGRLHRVLPPAAMAQVNAAIAELTDDTYGPASQLFSEARNAYDSRPRRDRDACSNVFDALESVGKIKCGMPNATFGDVINAASILGRLGGQARSKAKTKAVRANGALGGRPRKYPACPRYPSKSHRFNPGSNRCACGYVRK
jgi:hypothetical protein